MGFLIQELVLSLDLRLLPGGLLVESSTFKAENRLKVRVVEMALSGLLVDVDGQRRGLEYLERVERLSGKLLKGVKETRGLEGDALHAIDGRDGVDGATELATELEATQLLGRDLFVHVEAEPGVLERLRGSEALSGVRAQQVGDKIFCFDGHGFPGITDPSPLSVLNVDEHLLLIFELEGVDTGKQDIEDHTERPEIDRLGVAAVCLMTQKDELARHVGGSSDQCGHLRIDLEVGCKTEVGHLDDGVLRLGREQKILGLQITMADALGVQVRYSRQDLLEEASCFLFTKVMERDNAIEQLTTVNTVL